MHVIKIRHEFMSGDGISFCKFYILLKIFSMAWRHVKINIVLIKMLETLVIGLKI